MTGTKKKRQHYVPRFVLKHFSCDSRRISVFLLASGKRVDGASLRDQCYEDYFYGADQCMEVAFAAQELDVANRLADLSPPRIESLTEDDALKIKLFIYYQRQRTLAEAEGTDNRIDAVFRAIASKDPTLADIEIDKYQLRMDSPQSLALEAAAGTVPLVLDLAVKFLLNDTPLGFVLSDAPVAIYNQWAEHHPKFKAYRGYKGVALKGAQWFFPISPSVCVAVYDPTTYQYGSRDRRCCRASRRDVRLLNVLQALHARNCIYFIPDRVSGEELNRLQQLRASHPLLRVTQVSESAPRTRPDGKTTQLLLPHAPDPRIGARFHFARVIDMNPYRDYDLAVVPLRQPELVRRVRDTLSGQQG
jgi:hypothetical protein